MCGLVPAVELSEPQFPNLRSRSDYILPSALFQGHSPSTIHSLIDSHSFIHITFMPGMLTVTVKMLENQGA